MVAIKFIKDSQKFDDNLAASSTTVLLLPP